MIYEKSQPHPDLAQFVNCYWLVDSRGDKGIAQQKIVPDGYPEVILHYGDPYRINLKAGWEVQPKWLLAGQIRHHFFLENTGRSGMIGIKWQPTTLTHLFGLDMSQITGQVVAIPDEISAVFDKITVPIDQSNNPEALFNQINEALLALPQRKRVNRKPVDMAVAEIIDKKGNLEMATLPRLVDASERQLERQFKRYVGLSPKFYSRIIRLGHIFELMQQGDKSWSDLVFDSGFYDQSHFIKNFKEFTGEDPTAYGFDEENMANFHLRR